MQLIIKQIRIIICSLLLIVSMSLIPCTCDNVNSNLNSSTVSDSQIIKIENADDFFSIKDGFIHFGKETCAC